ncbi:hypothetical protein [Desulforegula conservatrix]|uniref:hypothetical protein n=1 Tax=Desulforegula conservatrix TaxID=153026 RepID=UPI0004845A32|nr:hypothetical protein [Desulforegula conservatrix]
MKNSIIYLSIIGFVLFAATAHAACPDEIPSLGKYRNYSFGFSILIPQGLKGFWNSAACIQEADGSCLCMSDHGRIIPLKNDNTIEIYAGHANMPLFILKQTK